MSCIFVCHTMLAQHRQSMDSCLEIQYYFSGDNNSNEGGTLIDMLYQFKLLKKFSQITEHRVCVLKCFCLFQSHIMTFYTK